jgi:signal transduction histidine kinase
LGWIISRMVFQPINQLILQVRSASGGAFLERLEIPEHGDLEELGERIHALISRINEAQEALDKTKKLLQYSNKYAVLGKVAPTVAHEIRNPLAAIKMLIYSMNERQDIPPDQKQDLQIITSEINRMDDFIRNFLKFARPPEPEFAPSNPVDVIREVIQLLRPKLKSTNIQLQEFYTPTPQFVYADAAQIKQIFINLLINALEAMPNGGSVTISTLLHTSATNNEQVAADYLIIMFEDTGHGIPENVLAHLFEPFSKGSDQGIGLGLSISQSIANLHKGWIDAKNKNNGSGAVFSVFLPLITES